MKIEQEIKLRCLFRKSSEADDKQVQINSDQRREMRECAEKII